MRELDGYTAAEIAEKWGITKQAFYCQVRRRGWTPDHYRREARTRRPAVWTAEQVKEMERQRAMWPRPWGESKKQTDTDRKDSD